MEYEAKLSDIIASLPEITGGFLYAPDRGIYSNQTAGVAMDDSLQQVGQKLSKIVSMLSVHFHDTGAIRIHFKDMVLFGTITDTNNWLFLFHQPTLSPGMLKMTVQMALNIEPDEIPQVQVNDGTGGAEIQEELHDTSGENITEILLDRSSGLLSSRYLAFLITTFPVEVNMVPFRALRVGITQSNISTPRYTPSTRSSGVPTPMR